MHFVRIKSVKTSIFFSVIRGSAYIYVEKYYAASDEDQLYLSNLLHQLLLPKQKDKFHETHFP